MIELSSPLGLIAGSGRFPIEFAEAARERGLEVAAVAYSGEADPALEELVKSCTWIKVGQVGKLIASLQKAGVRQVAFAGGIAKARLFGGIKLDFRAVALLGRLRSTNDDVILRGLAEEIEKSGIRVIAASSLLEKSVPSAGVLTRRAPDARELADARIGWEACREIGRLDIGQTVIVNKRSVVAVEAIEGTDAAIARGGALSGAGGVVVKLCKPQQDVRFDLPAVGTRTIENMKLAGASCLVLEAGKALLLEPAELVGLADRHSIAILVVSRIEDLQ